MKRTSWALASLALAAIVAVGALVWLLNTPHRLAPEPSDIGGAFRLVDQNGAAVDESVLRGKVSAVFFGYTYCPDVCPTTLANLGQAVSILGADATKFQVIFITIDPDRDTPSALRAYLASPTFPKGTLGLGGSPAQIAAVAKAYHVYYQKVPQGGSYTMDHSAVVYLMDTDGRFIRPLDTRVSPAQIAQQVRAALAGT